VLDVEDYCATMVPFMPARAGGEIGLVFQEPMTSFSPVHTIGNQIVENLQLHQRLTKREARDRTIELLRSVGIPRAEQRLDSYSYQLSGGLRQRAMIAMALACARSSSGPMTARTRPSTSRACPAASCAACGATCR
jgi:ABC-type microcin C transport system duplicated ATPase subunit YejF